MLSLHYWLHLPPAIPAPPSARPMGNKDHIARSHKRTGSQEMRTDAAPKALSSHRMSRWGAAERATGYMAGHQIRNPSAHHEPRANYVGSLRRIRAPAARRGCVLLFIPAFRKNGEPPRFLLGRQKDGTSRRSASA